MTHKFAKEIAANLQRAEASIRAAEELILGSCALKRMITTAICRDCKYINPPPQWFCLRPFFIGKSNIKMQSAKLRNRFAGNFNRFFTPFRMTPHLRSGLSEFCFISSKLWPNSVQ